METTEGRERTKRERAMEREIERGKITSGRRWEGGEEIASTTARLQLRRQRKDKRAASTRLQ